MGNRKTKYKQSINYNSSVTQIHSFYRGFRTRTSLNRINSNKLKRDVTFISITECQKNASIKIQTMWRGYKNRVIFKPMYVETDDLFNFFIDKEITIKGWHDNRDGFWIEDIVRDNVVSTAYLNLVIEQKIYSHNFFKKWFFRKGQKDWYEKVREYTCDV